MTRQFPKRIWFARIVHLRLSDGFEFIVVQLGNGDFPVETFMEQTISFSMCFIARFESLDNHSLSFKKMIRIQTSGNVGNVFFYFRFNRCLKNVLSQIHLRMPKLLF